MIRCIIIEDQPPAQRILKKYISQYGNLLLLDTFNDALSAIPFLAKNEVDLIFLDIHLPELSGMDFLKTLKNSPAIILTTAFADYAVESYQFNVVDYLLKPFSYNQFENAVGKYAQSSFYPDRNEAATLNENYPEQIFIKSGYEYIKVIVSDIYYIKSDADYTEIYTRDGKYISPEALWFWEENFNPKLFTRIHKSYIINLVKISRVAGNRVILENEVILPIGRTYKDNFMKMIL